MSCCLEPKNACDILTIGNPEQASCAALLSSALAPWEGLNPLAFACETLRQIATDLCFLESSLSNAEDGPLNSELVRRFVAGIEGRARAAAEVARRLDERGEFKGKAATNG